MLSASADRSEAIPRTERQSPFAAGPIPGGLDLPPAISYQYAYFPIVPKRIIAAIHGPFEGLGPVPYGHSDLCFSSDKAMLTAALSRRGLIAEHGIDRILPRVVGLPNALDLLLSERQVRAQEALQTGWINSVYPGGFLKAEVRIYPAEFVSMVSPRSLRAMEWQSLRTQNVYCGVVLQVCNIEMVGSLGCEDFKEGGAHLVEKGAS